MDHLRNKGHVSSSSSKSNRRFLLFYGDSGITVDSQRIGADEDEFNFLVGQGA
jgi:hypothetical protein